MHVHPVPPISRFEKLRHNHVVSAAETQRTPERMIAELGSMRPNKLNTYRR
jgi:hypothetical protein